MTLNQPYYIEKREGSSHLSLSGKWEFAYIDTPVEEIGDVKYELSATLPSSTIFLNFLSALCKFEARVFFSLPNI